MNQQSILLLIKDKLHNLSNDQVFSYKELQQYIFDQLGLQSEEDKNKCRSRISTFLTTFISSGVLYRKNKSCDIIKVCNDSFFSKNYEFIMSLVKMFSKNYKPNANTEEYEITNSNEVAMKYRIKNKEVQDFLISNQLWNEDSYQQKLLQFAKNKIAFNNKKLKAEALDSKKKAETCINQDQLKAEALASKKKAEASMNCVSQDQLKAEALASKKKAEAFKNSIMQDVKAFKDDIKKAKIDVILEMSRRNQLRNLPDTALVDAYNHLSITN